MMVNQDGCEVMTKNVAVIFTRISPKSSTKLNRSESSSTTLDMGNFERINIPFLFVSTFTH